MAPRTRHLGICLAVLYLAVFFPSAASVQDQAVGLMSLAIATALYGLAVHTPSTSLLRVVGGVTMAGSALGLLVLGFASPDLFKGPLSFISSELRNVPRPTFVFVQPNALAYLLLPAPLVASALGIAAGGRLRAAWLLVAVVVGAAIVATGSRAAILALGVGALVYALAGLQRAGLALLSTIAAAASLCLAILVMSDDPSAQGRRETWQAAIELAALHPLGPGYGRFAIEHSELRNAQNTALQTLMDFGLAGTIAVAATWVSALRASTRALELRNTNRNQLARATLASLCALIVVGMAESVLTSETLIVLSRSPYSERIYTVVSPIPLAIMALSLRLGDEADRSLVAGHAKDDDHGLR